MLSPSDYWQAFVADLRGLTLFWLGFGLLLCLAESVVPRWLGRRWRWVCLLLGLGAIVLGLGGGTLQTYVLPGLQVLMWMAVSGILLLWGRPLLPAGRSSRPTALAEATEAKTLTAIAPGETGRVLYEGSSWQAKCVDSSVPLAAGQTVYVLRREGTTLMVMPTEF